ncbi:MAG: hypothetical protein QXP53_01480 [Candidatus Pacearchaeota archaeon]
MGEGENTIIAIIIVLIVVVLSIVFLSAAYPQVFSFIRGKTLSQDIQDKMGDNFDILTNNIQECSYLEDKECICPAMPNFPGSFVKQVNLNINTEGKTLKIALTQGKKTIRNSTVPNFNLQILKLEENMAQEIQPTTSITLEFTKKFPFEKNKKQYIASEYIYKMSNELAFFLATTRMDTAEYLREKINKLPVCTSKRQDAIKEFENIKALILEGQDVNYKVILPQNYSIVCNKNKMILQHTDEEVKETTQKQDQTGKTILEAKTVQFEKQNLLCTQERATITFEKEIEIKASKCMFVR